MAARPLGRLFMLLCGLILIGLCFQYHGLSENLGYVDTASKGKYEHDTPQYINSNRYHMERINDRTLEITTPVADPRSQGATQTPRTRYEALPEPQSGSCPKIPPFLVGDVSIDRSNTTIADQEVSVPRMFPVKPGGSGRPENCIPRHRVALIVPFRDREPQLAQFLRHIHPILLRQLLDYRIFLIQQTAGGLFNKGVLFNAGVLEMEKRFPGYFTCMVLQDADTMPETDKLSYACTKRPKHMATYLDRYNYRKISKVTVGGIFLLDVSLYLEINGFSNAFYGWGGEDDDFSYRLAYNKIEYDFAPEWARCTALGHGGREGSYNFMLKVLAKKHKRRIVDGLNNVNYTVLDYREQPLFTNITVNVNIKEANEYLRSIGL